MSGFVWPRLLASCPNGGGVFVLDGDACHRLSHVDSTGLCVQGDAVWLATQAEGARSWRHWRGNDWAEVMLDDGPHDLHDLLAHGSELFAVSTEHNAVLRRDAAGKVHEQWRLDGAADACHLNSLLHFDGRWLASVFGRFEQHRGYKGRTRGAGRVLDLDSGDTWLHGLSQPHSLLADGDALWLCDSETGRVLRCRGGSVEIAWSFDGYTRGLCRVGDVLFVGLSRSRDALAAETTQARVLAVAVQGGEVLAQRSLPAAEVYDLRRCPEGLDLAAMALAEAELHRRHREAASARLHALVAERTAWAEAQDAALTEARAVLADTQTQLAERTAWAEAQDAELHEARNALAALHREFDERSRWALALQAEVDALRPWVTHAQALRGSLEHLLASRSWRLTRPLRALLARLRGGEAEIAVAPPPLAMPTPVPADPLQGLAFTVQDAPVVSIVVPSYGKLDYTAACLRAIRDSADRVPFEVIVIEDASGDADIARLATVPGLRYHANPENLGFLRSCNQARSLARGDYLCLLNNDTTPQPGWLDALLATFAAHPRAGLVGARLRYPDGRLQECGGIVWNDASGWNHGRLADPDDPAYRYVHAADYVSGAALLLPMALWRQLDGFDDRYAPAYYEDTDLAFRVREAGFEVLVQPAAEVVHHEGVSHGTDTGSGIKAHQALNQQVFRQRWREVLDHAHFANAEQPWLARDRAVLKKTVLVVDHYVPQPDRDAGSRAMWQLLQRLLALGLNVKFWPHNGFRDPVYTPWLEGIGVEVLHGPRREGFAAWYRAHAQCIEQVILSRPEVAAECIRSVRRHGTARVLYYGHDIHHQRMAAQAEVQGDARLHAEAARMAAAEHTLWRQADAVLYPSADETTHVRTWLDGAGLSQVQALTVPLYALPAPQPVAPTARSGVLFVAGFAHPPNEDAATWFVHEVWPRLRARYPALTLTLVGAAPTETVRALAGDGITVTGWVSDAALAAHYAGARVAAVPLRFGAGMKGKLVEALHHGVPVVTTPVGAQGLADAGFLSVHAEAEAFADAVSVLLDDDARWQAQADAGQAFVAERFGSAALDAVLGEVLDLAPYANLTARRAALARMR